MKSRTTSKQKVDTSFKAVEVKERKIDLEKPEGWRQHNNLRAIHKLPGIAGLVAKDHGGAVLKSYGGPNLAIFWGFSEEAHRDEIMGVSTQVKCECGRKQKSTSYIFKQELLHYTRAI